VSRMREVGGLVGRRVVGRSSPQKKWCQGWREKKLTKRSFIPSMKSQNGVFRITQAYILCHGKSIISFHTRPSIISHVARLLAKHCNEWSFLP
jgi:hypothetical protein